LKILEGNENNSFTERDFYTFVDLHMYDKLGLVYSFYNVTTCI